MVSEPELTGQFFSTANSSPAIDGFIYCVMGLFLVLAIGLFVGTKGKDSRIYSAKMAWIRAWMYFCLCWIISWVTGVLPTLLNTPFMNTEHLQEWPWIIFVAVTWLVVLHGYLIVWPKGTVTYERKFYPAPTLLLGLVWGISETQLFLAFWSIGENFLNQSWQVAIFTYVLASMSNGPLHLFYWDRYVSPDHNIYEHNMKKVGLAHNPTLILSLIYLVIWGDLWVYFLWPSFALLACAIAQKFPAPWDKLSHGEYEAQLGLCDVKTLSLPPEKRL